MPKPWWTGYPQSRWQEEDWAAWEKAGKPKLPSDVKLQRRDEYERPLVQPEPRHTLPAGVRWLSPSPRRDARGRSVDALLAKLGIK